MLGPGLLALVIVLGGDSADAHAKRAGTPSLGFHVGSCPCSSSSPRRARGSRVLVGAGLGPGNADRERLKRIVQLKKIKEQGGSYERLFDPTSGLEDDGEAGGFVDDTFDQDERDDEDAYSYLSEDKKSLLKRILRAKNSGSKIGAPGAGIPSTAKPSPYFLEAIEKAANKSKAATGDWGEDVETYMPQSVSWGKFPRPKNIPEAFGTASLDIPLGGLDLKADSEWEKSYKALMDEVREYTREVQGVKITVTEAENKELIEESRRTARRLMLKGEYGAACDVLAPLQSMCSISSQLGTGTLLDLASAYEATYQLDKAQDIYNAVKLSPIKDLRSKAKALHLGVEAMKKLNLGQKSKVNPRNLPSFQYIPAQLDGSYGLYMKSRKPVTYDEPEPLVIETAKDAMDVLEEAIIAQGIGLPSDLVAAALRAIHVEVTSRDQRGIQYSGKDYISKKDLDGWWRCRITSHQESVDFLMKPDVWQRLDSENNLMQGKLPLPPFEVIRDYKSGYSWDPLKRLMTYGEPAQKTFGMSLGKPSTLRVLMLRDTIMVTCRTDDGALPTTSYDVKYAVWTRA